MVELNEAKDHIQFDRAIETIKEGIPSSLLIEGKNPLTLLHAALSISLHMESDEDCRSRVAHHL